MARHGTKCLLVTLLVVGCDDEPSATQGTATDSATDAAGSTGTGGSTDSGSGDSRTSALAQAYCEKLFGCCDVGELDQQLGFFDPQPMDVASCVQTFDPLMGLELSSIEAAADDGRLSWDSSALGSCASSLAAVDCSEWVASGDPFSDMANDPTCLAMVTPLVEDGDACNSDRQCVQGDCSFVDDVCAPLRADVGETCNYVGDCRDPYVCDTLDNACAERYDDGAECGTNRQCKSGTCTGGIDGPGTCVTLCTG